MMAPAPSARPARRAGSAIVAAGQVSVGIAALLALLAVLTRHPLLVAAFALGQGLVLVGVIAFAVTALAARRAAVIERYGAGEVILRAGERARHVYVLEEGRVEVLARTADGGEDRLRELGPGDYFGETALVGGIPRRVTVRALTDVEVLRLRPSELTALYTRVARSWRPPEAGPGGAE